MSSCVNHKTMNYNSGNSLKTVGTEAYFKVGQTKKYKWDANEFRLLKQL